jgi:hypothetical protein
MHDKTHREQFSIHDAIRWCNDCDWWQSIRTDSEIDLWYAGEQDEDPSDGYFGWALERNLFNFDGRIEG